MSIYSYVLCWCVGNPLTLLCLRFWEGDIFLCQMHRRKSEVTNLYAERVLLLISMYNLRLLRINCNDSNVASWMHHCKPEVLNLYSWIFSQALCNVRPELWLQRIDLCQRNLFCKILPKEGIFWPKRTTEAALLGWLVKQQLFLFTFALWKLPFHSEKSHDMIRLSDNHNSKGIPVWHCIYYRVPTKIFLLKYIAERVSY